MITGAEFRIENLTRFFTRGNKLEFSAPVMILFVGIMLPGKADPMWDRLRFR